MVVVRAAATHEYDAVGELIVAAYDAVPGAMHDPEYNAELRKVAERAAVVPVLVAAVVDGVLGSLTYVPGPGPYAELATANEAEIRMFAVSPAAQGGGVGRTLLDKVIQRAAREDRSALVLSTSPWMTSAQRLYRSRGFERDPDRDRVELSSGREFELLAFRLSL